MSSLTLQNRGSLADKLAQQIRNKLQTEQFREGDIFMTETQVATEFDVSRTIVREAVSRLRALGILEGRQGKGLVVRRPDLIQLVSESVPSLAGSERDFNDLIELRYALEVGGIELAVTRASDAQIEQLQQIASKFSKAAQNGNNRAKLMQLELQFHTLLLEMTHSRILAGLNEVLARFFKTNAVSNLATDGSNGKTAGQNQETANQHFELVAAIKTRDIKRARHLIRSHIHCYLRHQSQANQPSVKRPAGTTEYDLEEEG